MNFYKEDGWMSSAGTDTTFFIRDLGCKVNQYESQSIREALLAAGFVESPETDAEYVIINSCTVTAQADAKTRNLIRRAARKNPKVKIILTGCYAVNNDDKKVIGSLDNVHAVIDNRNKMKIPGIIENMSINKDLTGTCIDPGHIDHFGSGIGRFRSHTRAFVKVQDGCDQVCTYCKVRIVRGASRSRDIEGIKAEVERLAGNGFNEIVLTGICLGDWRQGDLEFTDLLRSVLSIKGDFRIRLSSIEPNFITKELIGLISGSEKICKHFHVPLQSGSDAVLTSMKRKYTLKDFTSKIDMIRDIMPFAAVTLDIIAGFPGETGSDHEFTKSYLSSIGPSRLHVFKYSDRKGTAAYEYSDKVTDSLARKRVTELIDLGEVFRERFALQFIGRTVDVLVENKEKSGMVSGYTGEYVHANIDPGNAVNGEVCKCLVNGFDKNSKSLSVSKL